MIKRILFLFILLSGKIYADTYHAKANGYWNSSSTWDKGSVPGAGDDVVIDGYYVKVKSDEECQSIILKLDTRSDQTYLKIYDGYTLNVSGNVEVKTVSNYSENINLSVYGTLTIGGNLNFERASNNTTDDQLRLYISGGTLNLTGNFSYDYKSSSSGMDEKIINITSNGVFNCNDVSITQTGGGKMFIHMDDGEWNVSNNFTIDRDDGEKFEMCVYGASKLNITNDFSFDQTDCDDLIFKISKTGQVFINHNCTMSLSSSHSVAFDFRIYSTASWTVGTSSYAGNFTINYDANDLLTNKLYDGAQLTVYGDLTIDKKNASGDCKFSQYGSDAEEHSIVTIYGDLILKNSQNSDLLLYSIADSAELNIRGNIDLTEAQDDDRLKIVTYSNTRLYLGKNILRNSNYYGIVSCNESSTLYLNGNTQQTIAKNSGGGNDYIRYANVVLNNTDTTIPQFTMEGIAEIRDGYNLKFEKGIVESTSSKYFKILDDATVSDASDSSYIQGYIHKIGDDAFTFPVGNIDRYDNVPRYAPLTISAPSSTSTDFYCAYWNQDPDNVGDRNSLESTLDHLSSEEYWLLEPNTSTSVDVTLTWKNPRSGDVDDVNALRVAHWDGSIWNDYGNDSNSGSGSEDDGWIKVNNISTFSPFTLASISKDNPLPLEVLNFNIHLQNDTALLFWETLSEINKDYFVIERSIDGINFSSIGKVNAAGNSSEKQSYHYKNILPHPGIFYYRIKQVDFNNIYDYSEIKAIHLKNSSKVLFYPNPLNQGKPLTIHMDEKKENIKITIFDITGKAINTPFTQNNNTITINTSTLSKGIYTIQLNFNNSYYYKKIIID